MGYERQEEKLQDDSNNISMRQKYRYLKKCLNICGTNLKEEGTLVNTGIQLLKKPFDWLQNL